MLSIFQKFVEILDLLVTPHTHIPNDYFDICISLECLETNACSRSGPLARVLTELLNSLVVEAVVKTEVLSTIKVVYIDIYYY